MSKTDPTLARISLAPLATRQPLRAKVIFNPSSGRPEQSPGQLMEIIAHLQAWQITPEVYIVHPRSQLLAVAEDAIQRGIRLVVVCGGDGTIDSVMGALVGTPATLGIVPIGTRNNVALSLDIPVDNIPAAVALLRRGRRLRVDVGLAECGDKRRWFLEACTVGLLSALFPAADDIQHGNLARIGDLLATLVTHPLATLKLNLDGGREEVSAPAHVALVANMPYFGAHFQVSPDISFQDGALDVFIYANLTKLELIGYAVQMAGGIPEDPRIRHFRARQVTIFSDPPMPVIADGYDLGEQPLQISIQHGGLAVMSGAAALAHLAPRPPLAEEESTRGG